ncbi:hypothetical protein PoB_003645800 [Plakobranchus ocellatus]|uniref:Uncharacterized protein n=1 Tax=Plakobranchus ocellatus TaxID=259542 RepID=A0AAV4ARG7_9GAST|nr:hypothetical protein PoB_003645800 [Plakobranchus ocellatus]
MLEPRPQQVISGLQDSLGQIITKTNFWFGLDVSPQQGDLRFLGPSSGQGAGGKARTRNRRVPADLRADSLATVPPTGPYFFVKDN